MHCFKSSLFSQAKNPLRVSAPTPDAGDTVFKPYVFKDLYIGSWVSETAASLMNSYRVSGNLVPGSVQCLRGARCVYDYEPQ